jgi:O-antigen/teichoic acid export membrane protein
MSFYKDSSPRERRILKTMLSSSILRFVNMGIPLISLKLTYQYLEADIYGLWNALTAFFAFFAFTDLGLGNGLQTKLSRAFGLEDFELSNKIISSTFFLLVCFSLILLSIFAISSNFFTWSSLLNVKGESAKQIMYPAVLILILPKLISIPATIIKRTQLALQEGYLSDYWNIFGYLLNLIFIVIIVYFDLGKLTLLLATSLTPMFIMFVNFFYYFYKQKPTLKIKLKHFDSQLVKELLKLGFSFFVLSIFTTISLSIDPFIVARKLSLEDAASYSILFRISTIFSALISIISTSLWGANGDALAKGEIEWVIKNTQKMSRIMLIFTSLFCLVGMIFGEWFFQLWLGKEFNFNFSTWVFLLLFQVCLSFISPYFMVLNAMSKINFQIVIFVLFTFFTFFLKISLINNFGTSSLAFLGVICYVFIIIIPVYLYTKFNLRKLKSIGQTE